MRSAARPHQRFCGDLDRRKTNQHGRFDRGGAVQPTHPVGAKPRTHAAVAGGPVDGTPGAAGRGSRPGRAYRAPGSPGWVRAEPVAINQPASGGLQRRRLSAVDSLSRPRSPDPWVGTRGRGRRWMRGNIPAAAGEPVGSDQVLDASSGRCGERVVGRPPMSSVCARWPRPRGKYRRPIPVGQVGSPGPLDGSVPRLGLDRLQRHPRLPAAG